MIGLKTTISDKTNLSKLQNMLISHKTNTAIVESVYESVMRQFDSEGQGKWRPLSERTLKSRIREGKPYGPSYPMLQKSRLLKKSIQTIASPEGGLVYSNLIYARHQNNMRPFMVVDDLAKEDIRRLLIKKIKQD